MLGSVRSCRPVAQLAEFLQGIGEFPHHQNQCSGLGIGPRPPLLPVLQGTCRYAQTAGKHGAGEVHAFARVADEIRVHFEGGRSSTSCERSVIFPLARLLHGVDAFHQFIEQLALLFHGFRLLASNSAWIAFFNAFFSSVVRSVASSLS